MLPARFQALRVEVSAGEHDISVEALRGDRLVGRPQTVRVFVRDGFNTYVVALVPTLAGGPPPLTSEPVSSPEPTVVTEAN